MEPRSWTKRHGTRRCSEAAGRRRGPPSPGREPQETPQPGEPKARSLSTRRAPVWLSATVLRDAKTRYPMPQKILLALWWPRAKLRHYFRGHPIKVVSAYKSAREPQCRCWDSRPDATSSCKRLTWSSARPGSSRGLPRRARGRMVTPGLEAARTNPVSEGEAPDG